MTLEQPQVSVLMSVYSEPIDWIDQAVKSILDQTLTDFEYIIVNDNPASAELNNYLESLSKEDPRVRIIRNDSNIGLTKSLNVGLKQCRGKYIARMDADDWSFPTRLERQVDFMDANPDVIASSAFAYSWDGGVSLRKIFRPESYEEILSYTFTSSPFIHPLLIMRREILTKHDIAYDESFPRSQDYKLAVDLLRVGKVVNQPEYLLKYRISESQITSRFGSEQVELCKAIRRKYIADFYAKYCLGTPDEVITYNAIKSSKRMSKSFLRGTKLSKGEARNFKRSTNAIRRLYYYSLPSYSLKSMMGFLSSGDYFSYPYNLRRFLVILVKHFKSNIVPGLV